MKNDIIKKKRNTVAVSDDNALYLQQLAQELSEELGHEVSLVAANAYALNLTRKTRARS